MLAYVQNGVVWSIPYSFGLKAACLLSIQRTTNTLEKLHLDGYFGGMNSQEKRGRDGGDVFGQNSSSFFLSSPFAWKSLTFYCLSHAVTVAVFSTLFQGEEEGETEGVMAHGFVL